MKRIKLLIGLWLIIGVSSLPNKAKAFVDINGQCVAAVWNNYGGIGSSPGMAIPVYFTWNPYWLTDGTIHPDPVFGQYIIAEFEVYRCKDGAWERFIRDGRAQNVESWRPMIMEINGTDIEISFDQRQTATCCNIISPEKNFGPPTEQNNCQTKK